MPLLVAWFIMGAPKKWFTTILTQNFWDFLRPACDHLAKCERSTLGSNVLKSAKCASIVSLIYYAISQCNHYERFHTKNFVKTIIKGKAKMAALEKGKVPHCQSVAVVLIFFFNLRKVWSTGQGSRCFQPNHTNSVLLLFTLVWITKVLSIVVVKMYVCMYSGITFLLLTTSQII